MRRALPLPLLALLLAAPVAASVPAIVADEAAPLVATMELEVLEQPSVELERTAAEDDYDAIYGVTAEAAVVAPAQAMTGAAEAAASEAAAEAAAQTAAAAREISEEAPPITCPTPFVVTDDYAPVATWADRGRRLAFLPSGEIEFTSSQAPGTVFTLRRLHAHGQDQWSVEASGADSWRWTQRWGLPAIGQGTAGWTHSDVVNAVLGPSARVGLRSVWNWLTVASAQGPAADADPLRLDSLTDGYDRVAYAGWGNVENAGLEFPSQVSVLARSFSVTGGDDDELAARLTVQRVELVRPADAALGWPLPPLAGR